MCTFLWIEYRKRFLSSFEIGSTETVQYSFWKKFERIFGFFEMLSLNLVHWDILMHNEKYLSRDISQSYCPQNLQILINCYVALSTVDGNKIK